MLPELRDSKGNVIPVVVFSANGANDLASDAQVQDRAGQVAYIDRQPRGNGA